VTFRSDADALDAALRLLFEVLLEGTASPGLRARIRGVIEEETKPLGERRPKPEGTDGVA
jgi:hypothetical protein